MEELRRAEISWLKPEEGGRRILPDKTTYYAVANFTNFDTAWSVVVEFDTPPILSDIPYISSGYISLLVDYGPDYLLSPGSEFFIYEGPKKVAKILIQSN